MSNTINFRIPAAGILATAPYLADRADPRTYLRAWHRAWHIEPHPNGGALVVTCNGHCIGIYHAEPDTGSCSAPVTISIAPATLKALRKGPSGKTAARYLVLEDNRLTVCGPDDQTIATQAKPWEVDAAYPQWRQVLPGKDLKYGLHSQVNAHYLAQLEISDRACGAKKYNGWQFYQSDSLNVITCIPTCTPRLVVLIMPMRSEPALAGEELPNWLRSARGST